jgi:nitrogen regulatory protein PII
MAPVPVKLVRIITAWEAEERVFQVLANLGVTGMTTGRVHGKGVHGKRPGGLLDADNLSITVLVSPHQADQILEWVETHLVKVHAAVAYSLDAMAVPPDHFLESHQPAACSHQVRRSCER